MGGCRRHLLWGLQDMPTPSPGAISSSGRHLLRHLWWFLLCRQACLRLFMCTFIHLLVVQPCLHSSTYVLMQEIFPEHPLCQALLETLTIEWWEE